MLECNTIRYILLTLYLYKMKKLYLLRHAKTGYPQGVDDHNRPLTRQGIAACQDMHDYLLVNNLIPQMAICSDAVRTISTTKNILHGNNSVTVTANKKLYLATPGEILKEIAKIPGNINSLMVVGHNPGIGQLAFMLAMQGDKTTLAEIKANYPTCALTIYLFNIEKWQEVQPATGILDRFIKKPQ